MKKIKYFVFIISVILLAFFSLNNAFSQRQFINQKLNPAKGNIIFGLITKEDSTYYITKNWRSRSLVKYKIENEFPDIEKYLNKPVLAKGAILKADQPPFNRIQLESISKCWEDNKPVKISGIVRKGEKHIYLVEHPLPSERLMYIITSDKTKSIDKYDSKDITVNAIIKQENNWQKVYINIESIERQ
jgi:hypothetical protein